MFIDFCLVAFLGYLSYCLYIVIIIPYRKILEHDKKRFDDYVKTLEDSLKSK